VARRREGIRRGSRRSFSGLLITVALHAVIFWAIKEAHSRPQAPLIVPRDFVQAEMVKLGKPRDKFWLPKAYVPPPPPPPDALKISHNADAGAAPVIPAPSRTDPRTSQAVKNALAKVDKLIPLAEEDREGDPNGSKAGTSDHAIGDQYIATIKGMLMQNYNLPAGISTDQITTPPEIRFRIDQANGNLSGIKLTKSSGNPLVDDACVSAAQLTRQVPKPPPGSKVPGLIVACEK
jgi:TonB family protein